jgi:hypothetical protein
MRCAIALTTQHDIMFSVLRGGSQGNSVSIVSDYGLDDQAFKVRSPAEAK